MAMRCRRLTWKKMRNLFRELAAGCGRLLEKLAQFLGDWPPGYPCAVSKLSGMFGSWGTSHEICIVFWVSSRSADSMTSWKKLHNFLREIVTDIRCLSNMSAQFLQLAERA